MPPIRCKYQNDYGSVEEGKQIFFCLYQTKKMLKGKRFEITFKFNVLFDFPLSCLLLLSFIQNFLCYRFGGEERRKVGSFLPERNSHWMSVSDSGGS